MSRRHNGLAGERQLHHHAPIFAALGDERRLTLLTRLSDARPRSISRLAEGSRISRQAITNHLRVLEEAGLVGAESVGRACSSKLKPKARDAAQACLAL